MAISNKVLGTTNKRLKYNEIKEQRNRNERLRRARNKNAISDKIKTRVCNYLEEDINSRMLPGKNDTITKNKIKKNQKRVLMNSMKELHKQFLTQNSDIKVSYTMFCKLRPFWIVDPKCDNRDTSTCKQHCNR